MDAAEALQSYREFFRVRGLEAPEPRPSGGSVARWGSFLVPDARVAGLSKLGGFPDLPEDGSLLARFFEPENAALGKKLTYQSLLLQLNCEELWAHRPNIVCREELPSKGAFYVFAATHPVSEHGLSVFYHLSQAPLKPVTNLSETLTGGFGLEPPPTWPKALPCHPISFENVVCVPTFNDRSPLNDTLRAYYAERVRNKNPLLLGYHDNTNTSCTDSQRLLNDVGFNLEQFGAAPGHSRFLFTFISQTRGDDRFNIGDGGFISSFVSGEMLGKLKADAEAAIAAKQEFFRVLAYGESYGE